MSRRPVGSVCVTRDRPDPRYSLELAGCPAVFGHVPLRRTAGQDSVGVFTDERIGLCFVGKGKGWIRIGAGDSAAVWLGETLIQRRSEPPRCAG